MIKTETGNVYGLLTVEGIYPIVIRTAAGRAHGRYWVCRCACKGKTGYPGWKRVRGDSLRRGACRSCGCAQGYKYENPELRVKGSVL